ncbi:MAG: TonB-dependent receptor [Deltaproteobacteria bacterium]|nr:TonB-dependent receptor [Deltaproteobacteria bacterium]
MRSPPRLRARLASLTRAPLGAAILLASTHGFAQGAFSVGTTRGDDAGVGDASAAEPDGPPRVLRFAEAEYPAAERAAAREATVLLELTVGIDGAVADVRVIEGAGEAFDRAAAEALTRFGFAPARQAGQPVAVRIRYRYRFRLTAAQPAEAEPAARLRGVVRDSANHPVAGAVLTLQEGEQAPLEATSAADGTFSFSLARVGRYDIRVRREGFGDFRTTERIYPRDDVQVIYRLPAIVQAVATPAGPGVPALPAVPPPGDDDDQGVTVRGRRVAREVTRTTLERREITRIPGTGGDALRAIQNLPGLSRGAFLSGALIVRGSAPADTTVLVDGTSVPLLYHFGGLSSVIQTEMLDRIDFYPGNFSARFGRAMGGVVDVGLRSPRDHGIRGVVNVSAIDASLFVEGAILPNLTFAIAGRRSYVDVILNAVLSNIDSVGVTAAPVYYDYQGVLEWRPHRNHKLRFSIFGTDDALSILFRRPGDNAPSFAGNVSLATRYHIAQLLWSHDIAPGTQGRLMYSFGITGLSLAAGELLRLDQQIVPQNIRYELSHTLRPGARLNVGMDWQWNPSNTTLDAVRAQPGQPISSAQRISTSFTGGAYLPALYAEAELTPQPGLRVVPGIRLDYYAAIRQWSLSPRASARWDISRTWAIKGGLGLFTQQPSGQESSRAPNTAFGGQTIGNPNLDGQRATHATLGFEHVFSPYINVSVETFVKVLDRLVVATPTSQLFAQNPPPPYNNNGTGLVYGAEILLRHRPSERFFGWVAYTLLRATRRDGAGQDEYLYSGDQTHILTVLGSFRIAAGWEAGARFRLVTGSPRTPVVGAIYDANGFMYSQVNGARATERNPYFHQLDLRVDKTWTFSWGSMAFFVELINSYNAQNQEGVQYNYNYTESQPLTGLPLFPNLGLRGEWSR